MGKTWKFFLALIGHAIMIVTRAHEASTQEPPLLPLQFSAEVEITSHLVDPAQEYPSRTRKLWVHYDYTNQLARADILQGYEEGKTYIRRYDQVSRLAYVIL